jgi:recombination protein RecT
MNEAHQEVALTWEQVVHQVMPQFERISRDNGQAVRWAEECGFALQAIQKNGKLAGCVPVTVQNAVVNVAAVGLTLNPADGYAYLVPEYNKALKADECQLRISFKGLVKAATDTGAISWVKAEVVKANDTFEYRGPATAPDHSMNPFGDRGESVGVYCIAKTNEGDMLVDVMHWEEVLKIKACAKTQNVWDKWTDEMAKKAIIKRAAKQWPKTAGSATLHKAVEVINETEGTEFDPFAALESTAADILTLIGDDDLLGVGQVWVECERMEQETLWTAKTKGGWFTQDEKDYIRAAAQAYKKATADDKDAEPQQEQQ